MRIDDVAFIQAAGAAIAGLATAQGFETALGGLARAAADLLGDPDRGTVPGTLKAGERDYRIGGTFLITPDRAYNMLVGSSGFPPEQRRLMIPIGWNHPGLVVAEERPLLVADTDQDTRFRQFLKTSRMGSSLYVPILASGRMIGQIVAAAQPRGTYDAVDLDRLGLLGAAAAQVWHRFDGMAWLEADYPAPDAWRAEDHAV